jgi:cobalt-zinc-cadmium efflux system membrane fusion protein
MKRFISVVTLVLMILTLHNCSSETETAAKSEPELPPSIAGEEGVMAEQLIKLSQEQAAQLNIALHTIAEEPLTYAIAIPAMVKAAPDKYAVVSGPVAGRVTKIYRHEGEKVKKGQPLLALESLEYANLIADYVEASAKFQFAQKEQERIASLVAKKISSKGDLEKAKANLLAARARKEAATARLRAVGLSQSTLTAWTNTENIEHQLIIRAPIDGYISEHLIDLGKAVAMHERILTIIDLSEVLIEGYASPEEGQRIHPGDPVRIGLKTQADTFLKSRVHTINPALDAVHKSMGVYVPVRTKDNWPRPGQNVRLEIDVSTQQPVLAVPIAAIQYEGDAAALFIAADDRTFVKRQVQIDRMTTKWAIVKKGIKAGDKVAITNVFSLKALSKYDEFAE